jgi:hypothetical protein
MREKSILGVLVASAFVCAACGDDDVVGIDGGPPRDASGGDAPIAMDGGRDAATPDGGTDAGRPDGGTDGGMAVCDPPFLLGTTTATDFSVSGLATFELATSTVDVLGSDLSESDSVAVWSGCRAFVLNRGEAMVSVQTAGTPLTTAVSFDVDPAGTTSTYTSNPIAVLALSDTKAYVVNQSRSAITIVDPTQDGTAAILGEIDLSPYARTGDADSVDASDAILVGDRVYVALGHYWFDPDAGFAIQFEGSELAIIDPATDALVDADASTAGTQGIQLTNDNPWRGLAYVEEDARLWVGATGDSFAIDGAIEIVDPAAMTSTGTLIDEATLDAEITAFARVAADRVLVLAGGVVEAFDPADTTSTTAVVHDVAGMLVHDGTLYAWSRGKAAGLYTFDAATGAETTPSSGPYTFGSHPLSSLVPAP